MRITQLDRQYCRECGVETEVFGGVAALLDEKQVRCCRLCGSELVGFSEDADGPVRALVFPSATPPLLARGRH